MDINSLFKQHKPILSFEVFPPKTETPVEDIDPIIAELATFKPAFISVTFGAAGSQQDRRTLLIAELIKKKYNIETMVHLTCINHNREQAKELLDDIASVGVENILALRGDRAPDRPPVYDFKHASDLIEFIKDTGKFHISAACYPETHPETPDRELSIKYLKEKTDRGATHLISQLFFDNNDFYRLRDEARAAGITAPIEAGIMPITGKAQVERMAALCGAAFPKPVREMLERYGDEEREALQAAGAAYAGEQIADLIAHDVDGIHLYTMNNPGIVRSTLQRGWPAAIPPTA